MIVLIPNTVFRPGKYSLLLRRDHEAQAIPKKRSPAVSFPHDVREHCAGWTCAGNGFYLFLHLSGAPACPEWRTGPDLLSASDSLGFVLRRIPVWRHEELCRFHLQTARK